MQRSHAVHEGLHEAFLLNRVVLPLSRLALVILLDQLAVCQVHRRAHFNQGLDCREVAFLDSGEQRSLPIVVDYVDFGSEAAVLPPLRLRQHPDQVLHPSITLIVAR